VRRSRPGFFLLIMKLRVWWKSKKKKINQLHSLSYIVMTQLQAHVSDMVWRRKNTVTVVSSGRKLLLTFDHNPFYLILFIKRARFVTLPLSLNLPMLF